MIKKEKLEEQIIAARQIVASLLTVHNITPPKPRRASGVNDFSKPFGKFFDHTVLKPEATVEQVALLCQEAMEYHCASVCVSPNRVAQSSEALQGSDVAVCAVIGFPHGATTPQSKAYEVAELKAIGCREFDTVQAIGLLYDKDYYRLYCDISAVVEAARPHLTKVILETALLTDEQKIISGVIAVVAGANYLKTSTGFAAAGATVDDIALLRMIAGNDVGVKAAGGVRDYAFARQCIAAGADRIGCSRTAEIISAAEHGDVHG